MLRYEQTLKIPSHNPNYVYMDFEDSAAPILVETSEPDMVEMVRVAMAQMEQSDFHQLTTGGVYKVGINLKKLNNIVQGFGSQLVMDGKRDSAAFKAYGAGKSVAGDEAGMAAAAYADTFSQKYREKFSKYVKKVGRFNLKKLPYTIPVKFDISVKVQSTG